MIKFPSSFKLNEIHLVDSSFNEDPKNIKFFKGVPNFGRGTTGKFWKMCNNRDIYCYANRRGGGGWLISIENISRTKILVMPQFSYVPDQIMKKLKKLNF